MATEENDRSTFMSRLYSFMNERGTPISYIPVFDHRELDLYRLYNSVTARGGLSRVVESKLWRQVTCDLGVDQDRTDAGFRLRTHYQKYLYPYERRFFLNLPDDVAPSSSSSSSRNSATPTRVTRPKPNTISRNSFIPSSESNSPVASPPSSSSPIDALFSAAEESDENASEQKSPEIASTPLTHSVTPQSKVSPFALSEDNKTVPRTPRSVRPKIVASSSGSSNGVSKRKLASPSSPTHVNFAKLDMATLLRCRNYFLEAAKSTHESSPVAHQPHHHRPMASDDDDYFDEDYDELPHNKDELCEDVAHHFVATDIDECSAIRAFLLRMGTTTR